MLAATISLMAFALALAPTPAAAVDDVGNDACTDAIYLVDCTAADDSDDGGLGGTDTSSDDLWGGWETDAGSGDEGPGDSGPTGGGSTDSGSDDGAATGGPTDPGFTPDSEDPLGTGHDGSGGYTDPADDPSPHGDEGVGDPEDYGDNWMDPNTPIFNPANGGAKPPPPDSCYWFYRHFRYFTRPGSPAELDAEQEWFDCLKKKEDERLDSDPTPRTDNRPRKLSTRTEHRRKAARNAKKGRHVGHNGRRSR